MRLIEYRGTPVPTPFRTVVLAGFEAEFVDAVRITGQRVCVAPVPSAVDDLALTVRLAAFEGLYARIDPGQLVGYADAVPMVPEVLAVAPAPRLEVAPTFVVEDEDDGDPDGPRELPVPVQALVRNGWRLEDAIGLGGVGDEPDWGPGGGFSETSGLTVAQMAVCVAPPEWAALYPRFWPWEIAGWVPPMEFSAPAVASKVAADDDAHVPVVPEVADPVPETPAPPAAPPPPVVPADLSSWSPEEVAACRTRLAEIEQENGGPVPPSRAGYHLKKLAPSRTFTNQVLAALRG